jgi:stage II sporulation SpoE-like protein
MSRNLFPLCLMLGLIVVLLLLLSSIARDRVMSHGATVNQVRDDLSLRVAILDRALEGGLVESPSELQALLERIREESNGRIVWLQLRDASGATVARAGKVAPAGTVLVEAFPLRLPAAMNRIVVSVGYGGANRLREWGVIEIGALLNSPGEGFWHLRRGLLINSSAAVALLGALMVTGSRFRSYVERLQRGRQLEIARRVQAELLPPACTTLSDCLDIAADCVSAAGVGGDFYDFFADPDEENPAFVLGHVSGSGIPAAVLMGAIHGAVRSSCWMASPSDHETATFRINRLVCDHGSRQRCATMFWAYFERTSRMLRYINAGHSPPLLFRPDRRNTVLRLSKGGPVLGLIPRPPFHQGAVRLEPGDVLVLYSDGILEAVNSTGEQFGEERLRQSVEDSLAMTAAMIRDRILSSVGAFTGLSAPHDDRTVMVVRYSSAEAAFQKSELAAEEESSRLLTLVLQ